MQQKTKTKGSRTGWQRLGTAAVLALAVAAPGWAEVPPSGEVLTLDEAVTLALQNNRGVAVAAMQVERAEKKVGAARARRLPSLEVQAMAGTTLNPIRISFPEGSFGTFPATGPIPSQDTVVEAPRSLTGNVNATLAQPLTQLHRIGLNTRLNELSRDSDRQKLREERASVVADVRRLYYGLLQTQSALRAKEEEVRVYQELDRVVGQQVAVEAALRSDGLEVKARLAGGEYERLSLQGDLATGKEQLNQLLGRDLTHDFAVAAVAEATVEEVDLASALARAIERRPDLAQARLSVEQADTDRRMKKAESIPELSLAVTYYSFINVDLLPRNIAQVGLQLKWEPFDWGRRGKERAEKQIQVEQAKTGAKDAEDRARIEVGQRFRKLQEARLLVDAERLGREASEEKLRVVASRHQQDASLLKDVLEAQAAMSAAQAKHDRALLTFWTAKADFQKAIGEEQ
jgi:outer membrane protein TolC